MADGSKKHSNQRQPNSDPNEPTNLRHLLAQFEFGIGDEPSQRSMPCRFSTVLFRAYFLRQFLWTPTFSKRKVKIMKHDRLQKAQSITC